MLLFQHYTSAETCLSAFQAPVDPSTALGGFSGSDYSEVILLVQKKLFNFHCITVLCYLIDLFSWQASAFVVTYPVNNELDRTGKENVKAVAWEKAFIRLIKVLFGFSVLFAVALFRCFHFDLHAFVVIIMLFFFFLFPVSNNWIISYILII